MPQRALRLGDVLDDYCPQERRLTDHAIVAMIAGEVKQTRCTACDAEHEYKGAKVPTARLNKKKTPSLFRQVLAGKPGPLGGSAASSLPSPPLDPAERSPLTVAPPSAAPPSKGTNPAPIEEEGRAHRPLIRATLPRPEGPAPARPLPQFTLRQAGHRTASFRGGNARSPHRVTAPHGHATRPHGGAAGQRPADSRAATGSGRPMRSALRLNRGGTSRPADRLPHQSRSLRHPGSGRSHHLGKKHSK